MHIQPEILCATGVPDPLVHYGAVRLWVLPGMKNLMERIVDTDILFSPGVACKNVAIGMELSR